MKPSVFGGYAEDDYRFFGGGPVSFRIIHIHRNLLLKEKGKQLHHRSPFNQLAACQQAYDSTESILLSVSGLNALPEAPALSST